MKKIIQFIVLLIVFITMLFSCSEEPTEISKIRKLYVSKRKARAGDWLAEHQETYYDFDSYKHSHPIRPDSVKRVIYIYKLGQNTVTEDSLLTIICNYLEAYFHLKTKVAGTIPIEAVPDTMMRKNQDNEIQIRTHFILDRLVEMKKPNDAALAICLSKYDLYPSPDWNYVFGEAYLTKRVGVWSFNRFGDPNNREDFKKVLVRTMKVAAHEIGHIFSITHCVRYECTMNGSNSLIEMDESTIHPCPDCLEKLSWNIGFTLTEHFDSLQFFFAKQQLMEESAFMRENTSQLQQ